jgi:hypothetical protein
MTGGGLRVRRDETELMTESARGEREHLPELTSTHYSNDHAGAAGSG